MTLHTTGQLFTPAEKAEMRARAEAEGVAAAEAASAAARRERIYEKLRGSEANFVPLEPATLGDDVRGATTSVSNAMRRTKAVATFVGRTVRHVRTATEQNDPRSAPRSRYDEVIEDLRKAGVDPSEVDLPDIATGGSPLAETHFDTSTAISFTHRQSMVAANRLMDRAFDALGPIALVAIAPDFEGSFEDLVKDDGSSLDDAEIRLLDAGSRARETVESMGAEDVATIDDAGLGGGAPSVDGPGLEIELPSFGLLPG